MVQAHFRDRHARGLIAAPFFIFSEFRNGH